MACLLLSCLPLGIAPLVTATVAQATEPADDGPLITQLLGRWELYQHGVTPPLGVAPVLIFAPNGDLFYLEQPEDEITIVRSSWSFDTSQAIVETNLGVLLVTGKFLGPDLMELSIEELVSSDNADNDLLVIYARRVSSDMIPPGGGPIVEAADVFAERVATAIESEAKTYVGAINRLQQATYLEQQSFEPNIQALATYLGVNPQQSENYHYTIHLSANGDGVSTIATPKRDGLSGFVGRVSISIDSYSGSTLVATLCQSSSPTDQIPDLPDDTGACPVGYTTID